MILIRELFRFTSLFHPIVCNHRAENMTAIVQLFAESVFADLILYLNSHFAKKTGQIRNLLNYTNERPIEFVP